tara:strand:- start:70 stop:345 length:276 start_codon:yes stop_codon:yes gene_type:complete
LIVGGATTTHFSLDFFGGPPRCQAFSLLLFVIDLFFECAIMFPVMREQIEEKIAQWVYDLERTPHYPYLDKIVTDKDVEKLCEVVEKMFDK